MTAQAATRISLCCRAQASRWDLAICRSDVSVWQTSTAVQILGVVAGVAALAQHRGTNLQERRDVRTVRYVAVGAVVRHGLMLPEEWTALLRVAGGAGLVDRLLDEELGTV